MIQTACGMLDENVRGILLKLDVVLETLLPHVTLLFKLIPEFVSDIIIMDKLFELNSLANSSNFAFAVKFAHADLGGEQIMIRPIQVAGVPNLHAIGIRVGVVDNHKVNH